MIVSNNHLLPSRARQSGGRHLEIVARQMGIRIGWSVYPGYVLQTDSCYAARVTSCDGGIDI